MGVCWMSGRMPLRRRLNTRETLEMNTRQQAMHGAWDGAALPKTGGQCRAVNRLPGV